MLLRNAIKWGWGGGGGWEEREMDVISVHGLVMIETVP